jgi:hypothetical protein
VLEIGFDLLSAAVGLFVVAIALRVASAFTLYAHRQAMRVLAAAAATIVVSEFIGIAAALRGPSTFTDAAEELAELVPSWPPLPCCTTWVGSSEMRSPP